MKRKAEQRHAKKCHENKSLHRSGISDSKSCESAEEDNSRESKVTDGVEGFIVGMGGANLQKDRMRHKLRVCHVERSYAMSEDCEMLNRRDPDAHALEEARAVDQDEREGYEEKNDAADDDAYETHA